jgi:hypothetical protein
MINNKKNKTEENNNMNDLINEFTATINPNETIGKLEYFYFKEAIKAMGLRYTKRINKIGIALYDPQI